MIGAAAIARRFVDPRRAVAISLLLIIAMSFSASVVLTEIKREAAYFLTYTRIWQLGVGALLAIAVLPDFSPRIREIMRTIGLGAIVLAAFGFSAQTDFPGYAALLPTLGCALVLAAGSDSDAWSISRLLTARPAQYLGDISYSVYLWHWPMVVFVGHYAPDGINLSLGLTIVAATIVIAHMSKRFLEDPIRYSKIDTRKALAFATGLAICCIIGATAIYQHFALQLIKVHADSPNYPGARAFLAGADVPQVDAPIPPSIFLKKDKAEVYKDNCHVNFEDSDLTPCRYGPEGGVKVVLMGDSHAANWAPALISQAQDMGWRLETHTKSACPVFRGTVERASGAYLACKKWADSLLQYLQKSRPDIIIVAQSRSYQLAETKGREPRSEVATAVAGVWRELLALGIKVVAIRDTPKRHYEAGECVASDTGCHVEQSKVLGDDDPILMAHGLVPEVPVIDMTDAVCQNGKCPMVIGNVVVWRDREHLTASYSRTVATALTARIVEATSNRLAALPQ
jgi:hypothetical protein